MSERQKQDSEKILISNILIGVVLLVIVGISLIPKSLKIISNRPFFHDAEVEPDMTVYPREEHIRRSLGIFIVTAYCPCKKCCGRFADGITANGHIIQIGDRFCAADPSIPFGKYLDIPDYGYVPVWDRGGLIKGNKLDVFFPTHEEALEWGTGWIVYLKQ